MKIARRTFLVAAGVVAARLKSLNGYRLPAADGEMSFGAWLKLARDGQFEVVVPNGEMGQGIYSLAILLCRRRVPGAERVSSHEQQKEAAERSAHLRRSG